VDLLVHNAGFTSRARCYLRCAVRAAWIRAEAVCGMVEAQLGRIVLTTVVRGPIWDGPARFLNPQAGVRHRRRPRVVGRPKALRTLTPGKLFVNASRPRPLLVSSTEQGIVQHPAGSAPGCGPSSSRGRIRRLTWSRPARCLRMHETARLRARSSNVLGGTGRVGELFVGVTRVYVSPDGDCAARTYSTFRRSPRHLRVQRPPVDSGHRQLVDPCSPTGPTGRPWYV